MLELYKNIKNRRLALEMTQSDLAKLVGYADKSMIAKIEKGEVDLSQSKIKAFASALRTTPGDLTGEAVKLPNYSNIGAIATRRFPVLGTIACGEPIYMDEQRDLYVEGSADVRADFVLYAKGDSMVNARINDGDIVFVREQPVVENGQIAAVAIDDEATLKRVYITDRAVTLVAENPKYPPMVFQEDFADRVRILGLAVAFQSDIR